MKPIILFLILLISSSAFAFDNWVLKSDFKNATDFFDSQGRCEAAMGGPCIKKGKKDQKRFKVGFLEPMIDSTMDCDDAVDCQAQIDDTTFSCSEGAPSFDDKANWPALDFSPRPSTGWFLWCQVESLVVDASGSSAADAEEAAKAADRSLKVAAKAARMAGKDACVAAVNSGGNLTSPEIKDCIDILVKEVFAESIPGADQ